MILYLVLIASVLDDWADAGMLRLSAEELYKETLEDTIDSKDEASLELMVELREELDALTRFKDKDMLELHGASYSGLSDSFEGIKYSHKSFWEDDSNENDKDYSSDDKVSNGAHVETRELELPVRPGSLQNPTQAARPRTITCKLARLVAATRKQGKRQARV